jgi:hypothetical protein
VSNDLQRGENDLQQHHRAFWATSSFSLTVTVLMSYLRCSDLGFERLRCLPVADFAYISNLEITFTQCDGVLDPKAYSLVNSGSGIWHYSTIDKVTGQEIDVWRKYRARTCRLVKDGQQVGAWLEADYDDIENEEELREVLENSKQGCGVSLRNQVFDILAMNPEQDCCDRRMSHSKGFGWVCEFGSECEMGSGSYEEKISHISY